MTRAQAIEFLTKKPYKFGQMIGFTKLTPLHNEWIIDMLKGKGDRTMQSSRGTYKTTCVSIALALICILLPNKRTLFMRKTDTDVKEVVKQVQKILSDPHTQVFVQAIYGVALKLSVQSATEISTNLTTDIKGTNQLVGIGIGSSLTGKHFDYIFTDDIVNINDRISKAERDRTKLIYQELQNIKNRDGRIFNTGTPWHRDDAFAIMPEPVQYDCYKMQEYGVMTAEEIEAIKERMSPALFAANYELRHIASEDVIFTERPIGAPVTFIHDAICHIDSAFYGEDYTAWSAMAYVDGKFYLYGRCWRKNVQDCYEDILKDYQRLMLGKCFNEKNADKGMVARDLKKIGMRMVTYDEHTNKHIKIVTYLKAIWNNVIFVEGTDPEYIEQIYDYTEDAAHDDAPDSASCLARRLYRRAGIQLGIDLGEVKEEDE